MHHTETIIEVKGLSYAYNGDFVLENINLQIHKGDYLGIVGPNGGGKTTLLKCILGLIKSEKGTIELFGKQSKDFHEWWRIGYVPQRASRFELDFPATVREVVGMGLYAKKGLFRFLNKADQKIINKALEHVDMHAYADRLISDLSGGQQQRVFIAKALVSEPEVVFLDEPTVGVDQQSQAQFYALLKELNKNLHLTLVLVTHDIDVIVHEATEIACVDKTIQYHGKPKDFIENDVHTKLSGRDAHFVFEKP